jgi:hypothetical protein
MSVRVAGREIDGELACPPVTTYGSAKDRWVEFELYALADGSWLIHRIGKSNIYHRADTLCTTRTGRQSGEPAGVDDLPDEAMPCPRCHPPFPEDLPEGAGTVRYEYPRHTWDECPTPELVREKLTTIRSRDGSVTTYLSDPVADLLRQAAARYPEFTDVASPAA